MQVTEAARAVNRVLQAAAAATLLASIVGCSDGKAHVTGVVRLDGEPLAGEGLRVTVLMKPTSGGPAANGNVADNGSYRVYTGSAAGIQPGSYKISVVGKRLEPNPDPNYPPRSIALTPPRYANTSTSGLTLDAVAGSQTFDIELTSDE